MDSLDKKLLEFLPKNSQFSISVMLDRFRNYECLPNYGVVKYPKFELWQVLEAWYILVRSGMVESSNGFIGEVSKNNSHK